MTQIQKITPSLWFDKDLAAITTFYTSIFPGSSVGATTKLHDTPSGTVELATMELLGQKFDCMTAGPLFTFNPSISFFVVFDNEQEIAAVWNKLAEGGKVLMPYDTYPWANKYGWLQDKHGVSWQLSWSEHHTWPQRITPMLTFTQGNAGRAKEALALYTQTFPDSSTEALVPYTKDDGDTEGFIKHARFTLLSQGFMVMDSSAPHAFTFNEAVSLVVRCETQEEIDRYWEKLSAVPEAEQCGWLKDQFGVSWQIVPATMDEMMASNDQAKIDRVTQALLQMKKLDVAKLEEAARG